MRYSFCDAWSASVVVAFVPSLSARKQAKNAQDLQNFVGNGKISHLQPFVKKYVFYLVQITDMKLNENIGSDASKVEILAAIESMTQRHDARSAVHSTDEMGSAAHFHLTTVRYNQPTVAVGWTSS